jgi:hypothetical protein
LRLQTFCNTQQPYFYNLLHVISKLQKRHSFMGVFSFPFYHRFVLFFRRWCRKKATPNSAKRHYTIIYYNQTETSYLLGSLSKFSYIFLVWYSMRSAFFAHPRICSQRHLFRRFLSPRADKLTELIGYRGHLYVPLAQATQAALAGLPRSPASPPFGRVPSLPARLPGHLPSGLVYINLFISPFFICKRALYTSLLAARQNKQ